MRQLRHVTSEAVPDCVRPLRDMVGSAAGDAGASDTEISLIKLCVSEAIANAVKHAYPHGESGPVDVAVECEGGEFLVTVADHGQSRRKKRSGPRGGFGLAFVERLANGCTFRATSTGTTVEMSFVLGSATRPCGEDPLFIEHHWLPDRPVTVAPSLPSSTTAQ